MRQWVKTGIAGVALSWTALIYAQPSEQCPPSQGVALQVLGSDASFIDFARDASALVMHMAVPDGASGAARRLHAPPGLLGDIARESAAKYLVLSHLMARSLRNPEQNLETIRTRYHGPVLLANDLDCLPLAP